LHVDYYECRFSGFEVIEHTETTALSHDPADDVAGHFIGVLDVPAP
jgi:hypothetical protein